MSDRVKTIKARAYPVGDAQSLRLGAVRSELGLPNKGRVRLKNLVQEEQHQLRIGSLNIGTMNGKSREVVDLMRRRKLQVLCVQETRWKGNQAKGLAEGYKLFYSGANKDGRNGVGIILDKSLQDGVSEVNRRSDRIITVRVEIGGSRVTVVCGYAPQSGCVEEEKLEFWRQLDEVVMGIPEEERIFIGADLNGHVGERRVGEERVHGGWSIGQRNEEGERIMEHAVAFDMAIANTWFEKREDQLVTYKSGNRNSQIDYILFRRNRLTEITNCKVIKGECVAAQHRLVLVVCSMKGVKGNKWESEKEPKINWWKLKEEGSRNDFKEKVIREIRLLEDVQEWWDVNSKMIRRIGEDVLGRTSGKGMPKEKETWWWNEDVQREIRFKKDAKKRWDLTGTEIDREAYRVANKNAKRVVARARAKAVDEAYADLAQKGGEGKLIRIAKARDRASKDITSIKQIKDGRGVVLRGEKDIKARWKEYFQKLLNEENPRAKRGDGEIVDDFVDEISREEVVCVLRKMKNGKAVGVDQIPVEAWKSLGSDGVDILWDLMKKLAVQEKIPDEWRKSVLVPIYKGKGDVQDCSNYRGIKLMGHTMKIWERVIEARIRRVTKIGDEQFGFMPGRGTTDAIFALRQLMEKCREKNVMLHMVFIDLEKAYDRVPRQEVWRCMRKRGVPEKYVRMVKEMYREAETQVRSSVGMTGGFPVVVGLHQGSALSPYLFDLVMDVLVEDVRLEAPWSMLFADDIVLCEMSSEGLERKVEAWRKVLEERGMKISRAKTEYMSTESANVTPIRLLGETLQAVEKFKYLGSVVEKSGGLQEEIKHRIGCGWMNWRRMKGVLCDKRVNCKMKGKIYKTVVRPAMLHGAETWQITKAQERKMEVAEMRMLRWMSGVTRKDRVRNVHIRGTVKVGPIGKKIQESRLRWFGHVERRDEEYVGKRVERIDVGGKRSRGRPKLRWKDKVAEDLREKGWRQEEAQNRTSWREKIRSDNADPV